MQDIRISAVTRRARCRPKLGLGFGAAIAFLLTGAVSTSLEAASDQHAARTEATRALAHKFLVHEYDREDMEGAYHRYASRDFIQHNPHIGNGTTAHAAFFRRMERASGGPVKRFNVTDMLLVDGDLFAVYHHAYLGKDDPGRIFVDIWRVANGRIVEHWDVIQPIPAKVANANGVGCGIGEGYAAAMTEQGRSVLQPACGLPDPGHSREASLATLEAYTGGIRAGAIKEAILTYLSPDYRQHSPFIPDGRDGAIAWLSGEYGKGSPARPVMGPMRTIAQGDFVLQHRLTYHPDTGQRTANVDIFRMRGGQITEHWDLSQPVPDRTASGHEMW